MLIRARQQGYLSAVRPVFDRMLDQDRHISPTLPEQTLRAIGESEQDKGYGIARITQGYTQA